MTPAADTIEATASETIRTRVRGNRASKQTVEGKSETLLKILTRDSREVGYSNLSVDDLARRSGMPRSTVRRYLTQLQAEGRIVRRPSACGVHADGRPSFAPALTAVSSNEDGVAAVLSLAG